MLLYEPLVSSPAATAELEHRLRRFAQALTHYRGQRFAEAVAIFEMIGDGDPVARKFAERANDLLATPPADGWDGVKEVPRSTKSELN